MNSTSVLWASCIYLEAHCGNPFRRMAGAQMHGRSTDAWQEHRCMAGARTVRALLSWQEQDAGCRSRMQDAGAGCRSRMKEQEQDAGAGWRPSRSRMQDAGAGCRMQDAGAGCRMQKQFYRWNSSIPLNWYYEGPLSNTCLHPHCGATHVFTHIVAIHCWVWLFKDSWQEQGHGRSKGSARIAGRCEHGICCILYLTSSRIIRPPNFTHIVAILSKIYEVDDECKWKNDLVDWLCLHDELTWYGLGCKVLFLLITCNYLRPPNFTHIVAIHSDAWQEQMHGRSRCMAGARAARALQARTYTCPRIMCVLVIA